MHKLLLAALLMGTAASPAAAAWQYHEHWGELDTWIRASDFDSTNAYELTVNCSDLFPDESDIAIDTQEDWNDTTSYASDVQLILTVDGVALAPLKAKFMNMSGKVSIVASELDETGVRPAFAALQGALEGIQVAYFDTGLSFSAQGNKQMIGKFLETCNGEAGF